MTCPDRWEKRVIWVGIRASARLVCGGHQTQYASAYDWSYKLGPRGRRRQRVRGGLSNLVNRSFVRKTNTLGELATLYKDLQRDIIHCRIRHRCLLFGRFNSVASQATICHCAIQAISATIPRYILRCACMCSSVAGGAQCNAASSTEMKHRSI